MDNRVVRYANAYITDRLYGGPEEGGWYYDVGDPIMSLPFIADEAPTKEDHYRYDEMNRNIAYNRLYELCEVAGLGLPEREYFQKRDWIVDGYKFYIEDKPGETFPKKRPHWDMGEDY